MNALNRIIMLIIALLLIIVPVLLLLVAFQIIPTGLAETYTRYQTGLDLLGSLSESAFDQRVRTIVGIVGGLVVLVSLLLLMRELTFGRSRVRNTVIQDTPGKEIKVTASAVRALAEAAAREAGAISPSVALRSNKRAYTVFCGVQAPRATNRSQIASRARENIRQALESQNVPVRDVEITVQGTSS